MCTRQWKARHQPVAAATSRRRTPFYIGLLRTGSRDSGDFISCWMIISSLLQRRMHGWRPLQIWTASSCWLWITGTCSAIGGHFGCDAVRYLRPTKLFHRAQAKRQGQGARDATNNTAKALARTFELAGALRPQAASDQQLMEWRSFL